MVPVPDVGWGGETPLAPSLRPSRPDFQCPRADKPCWPPQLPPFPGGRRRWALSCDEVLGPRKRGRGLLTTTGLGSGGTSGLGSGSCGPVGGPRWLHGQVGKQAERGGGCQVPRRPGPCLGEGAATPSCLAGSGGPSARPVCGRLVVPSGMIHPRNHRVPLWGLMLLFPDQEGVIAPPPAPPAPVGTAGGSLSLLGPCVGSGLL